MTPERAPKNWTRGWRLSRACGAAKPSAFMARITPSSTSPCYPSRCNPPEFLSGWRGGWPHKKQFRRAARWDGIYLMTVNQVTGALLAPDEIREIVGYVKTYRPSSTPFEVAVNGELSTDGHQKAERVQRYEAAGATWWVEYEAPRAPVE